MRVLLLALLLSAAGCRSGAPRVSIDLPPAPEPLARDLVAAEVGRLLSADTAASRQAEQRLTSLDHEGRMALSDHAERIPAERDPRWLLVLEENHLAPALPPKEEIAYLLWKSQRAETFYVMKAQNRLLELARSEPDAMLLALDAKPPGDDVLLVALALAGERRAFPRLRDRYAAAETAAARRGPAVALTQLTGSEVTPRVQGSPTDIQSDVGRLDAWWAEHQPGDS